MATDTGRDDLWWCLGRLQGLAGTTRYELPDEFREELRQTTERLESAIRKIAN